MGKRDELELELSNARKERDRNYELKCNLSREVVAISEDMDERIRRIDQYLSSRSMSEKDKQEYVDKRLNAVNRYVDFEDSMEDLRRRIVKRCEESDYMVSELEHKFSEMREEEEEQE